MLGRYKGKSFLRLLELYVLWSIGRLTTESAENLEQLTPKLRATYNMEGGSWHEIIAKQMDFPSDLPAQIKSIWMKNLEIAKANGTTLEDEDFARMFVDKNFNST